MKILLLVILLASSCGKEVKAQVNEGIKEGNNPETKPESDISAKTKKVLRKIGRKSMDETCRLSEDKATCEKEKLEHKRANLADEKDTERRNRIKAEKKEEEAKVEAKKEAKKETEDKTP